MSVTRRSFLKFFGGASVGAVLSPLPWKLLDDVSIWTQNGTWVEHPARGPVSHLYSTCTLCPAGCSMKLRRVGERVVSAWGVPGHPFGAGRLCPAGLGVAQIPFHPARLRGAAARGPNSARPWNLADAGDVARDIGRKMAGMMASGDGGNIAVLDLRPGRSLSVLYREFADAVGGRYLVMPDGREQSAAAMNELVGAPGAAFGLDLERAGAVVSFGAPLEGAWLDRSPYLVQVQTNRSVSTGLADRWLPVHPGSEAALALGLAFTVRHEIGLASACRGLEADLCAQVDAVLADHTPEKTAAVTGVAPRDLRKVAAELLRHGPAVAVGGGDPAAGPLGQSEELAVGILNLVLGAFGRPGGLVSRPDTASLFDEQGPAALTLGEVPDGSLDLLLVDGALPSSPVTTGLLRRKMRHRGALIVALTPWTVGPAAGADYLISTAAPGEWVDDVPTRALSPRATYALGVGSQEMPPWTRHPGDALGLLAEAAGLPSPERFTRDGHRAVIDRRIRTLHSRGRGRIFDPVKGTTSDLGRIGSPRALKKILERGGCWFEEPDAAAPSRVLHLAESGEPLAERLAGAARGRLEAHTADRPLIVMPFGPAMAAGGGVLPPVVNKLYRESNLMPGAGRAFVNPATARDRNLRAGRRALLETDHGRASVLVTLDERVMPGVVQVAAGPGPECLGDPAGETTCGRPEEILEACGAAAGPVWRVERASLREL